MFIYSKLSYSKTAECSWRIWDFLKKTPFPSVPEKSEEVLYKKKNYSANYNTKKVLKVKKEYRTDVKIRP